MWDVIDKILTGLLMLAAYIIAAKTVRQEKIIERSDFVEPIDMDAPPVNSEADHSEQE